MAAHTFTLIVPELHEIERPAGSSAWRQLARLAGRGSLQRIWNFDDASATSLRPWQYSLLRALGLHADSGRYASAPLTMTGITREPATGFWMHAELVHLAAGLDSLSYVPLRSHAAVGEDERRQLHAMMADHFRTSGFVLRTSEVGSWMVKSDRRLDVVTTAPEAAAHAGLEETMPRGADAGELRRLMTECQMLLHDHPVNVQRARHELPAVNAIWFWGGGEARPSSACIESSIVGDDPYVRGLCMMLDRPSVAVPADVSAWLREPRADTVAVIAPATAQTIEERWLVPLVRALQKGTWSHLDLMIEGRMVSIGRAALWRFWRRARPPAEWLA